MRQFISPLMPDHEGRIVLNVKEYRYLSRVLRLKDGAHIDVRLPGGALIQMKFRADKTKPSLKIINDSIPDTASKTDEPVPEASRGSGVQNDCNTAFWLFQFLPKVQKADLIVRQAAECGVNRIVVIRGEYSPPYTPRTERWQRIIREARQQSGSPVETEITDVLSVQEATILWTKTVRNTAAAAFILCEREEGQKSVFTHIRSIADTGTGGGKDSAGQKNDFGGNPFSFTALAAGCEGGISRTERNLLEQSGFVPIHFKTNILRSETAALYGLAAIQSALTEYTAWKLKE